MIVGYPEIPADTGESMAQIAAIQESIRHRAENRSPKTMLFGKAFLVHTLEFIDVVFDQPLKRGGFGIGRLIDAVDSFRHNLPNGRTGGFSNLKHYLLDQLERAIEE